MASSTPKSLPALIGGAIAVLVAGYFGINLTDGSSSQSSGHTTAAHAPSVTSSASTAAQTGQMSGLSTCPVNTLPKEALHTVDDILAGGPYEHPQDDNKHFGNYQGVLPKENSNYYREYTVDTPGINHRGERRIVTGGGKKGDPDTWYYTDDHYESFCVIPNAEDERGAHKAGAQR